MVYDLDHFTFEEWLKFVFDHPVVDPTGLTYKEKHWYLQGEWYSTPWNGFRQVEFCTKLFENPSVIKGKYSWEQIEEGLWFLLNEVVLYLLHDTEIPWINRKKLIENMGILYEKLFLDDLITLTCFMWWDGLCYNYYRNNGVAENEDSRNVQNTAFETLRRILKIESISCQVAALHGLGHVRHPETASVINKYLIQNPHLSKRIQDYAKGCIEGTMDRMGDPMFEKGGPKNSS